MFPSTTISPSNERAIQALLRTSTVAEAAEAARISAPYLERLLARPSFQRRLRVAREEALSRAGQPAPGELFGDYRILERLTDGAAGSLYRARDLRHRRVVALKLVPRPQAFRDKARRRARNQILSAAGLYHPNICPIYEVGEFGGNLFVAMACASGLDLADMLKEGPLPVEGALEVACQIAGALCEAHSHGVGFCGITPQDVVVSNFEDVGLHVTVMIFRWKSAVRAALLTEGDSFGRAYFSPEQTSGLTCDERTDVWALGVTLYEMLAGRPPFRGACAEEVSYSILFDEPEPVLRLRPEAPPGVEWVMRKALAKSPNVRYESIGEMRTDLRELLERRRRRSRATQPPLAVAAPAQELRELTSGSAPQRRRRANSPQELIPVHPSS